MNDSRPTRIAAVQHGDYREALELVAAGRPEPYYGMGYTLRCLADLFSGDPHVVISLDAPVYRIQREAGTLIGMPAPAFPPWPGRLKVARRVRWIIKELEQFQPSHVLLRSADLIGLRVLEFCRERRVNVLAVFANIFPNASQRERRVTGRIVELLNGPNVFLAGNHKSVATQSMLAAGLSPQKAMAWDWPGMRSPDAHRTKRRDMNGVPSIAFVGGLVESKGVTDLLDAAAMLHSWGRPVRVSIAGDGPAMGRVRELAAALPGGSVDVLGRVGNDQAFDLMVRSDLVCVPSRHQYTEGMPLTFLEALASRTPIVAADHPVLVSLFKDGEGVRFFEAANPSSLASLIQEVTGDGRQYELLSESTIAAFRRAGTDPPFGELLSRWKGSFRDSP